MIDGIIKADGTSRLMRAELPATYEEFRAQCHAGVQPLDVLFNAIGWRQLPTFLNKASLQRDETANLFGLGNNVVIDDLFSWIGQYNTHWWSRKKDQSYYEAKLGNKYPYADGYSQNNVIIYDEVTASSTNVITLKTADSVSVDLSGNVTLVNPTVYENNRSEYDYMWYVTQWVAGKYCQVSAKTDSLAENEVFFVPSTAQFWLYNTQVGASEAYQVISVLIQAGETTYVHSTDQNAYPDSGVVDGYEYQYLGVPFQNAVTAPKIATGSYAGTGTYGSSNPNSLTFDFEPKLVLLSQNYNNGIHVAPLIRGSNYAGVQNSANTTVLTVSWNGNSVYWYSKDSAALQFNNSNRTYAYVAIG